MKKAFKNKFQKKKIVKEVGMVVIFVLVIAVLGINFNNKVRLVLEKKEFSEQNVGHNINVDGKSINIYSTGNKESDNKIIFMQGLGTGDVSISTAPMCEYLKDECEFIIINRAGNGLSSDTKQKRSVENIVSEYRKTLKEEGENPPYVLAAHSISGMYAAYWASMYPEEILGIVYIDATPAETYIEGGKLKVLDSIIAKGENILANVGVQRFVSSDILIGNDYNHIYTEEQNRLRKNLMYQNTYSDATYSEMQMYYQNAQMVLDSLNIENIPQLYISADLLSGSYYQNVYCKKLEKKYGSDQKRKDDHIAEVKNNYNKKIEYVKSHGAVDVKYISGPHNIYEYAPLQVAEEISQFIRSSKVTEKKNNLKNCDIYQVKNQIQTDEKYKEKNKIKAVVNSYTEKLEQNVDSVVSTVKNAVCPLEDFVANMLVELVKTVK